MTTSEKEVMLVGLDDSEHSVYALEWILDHFFTPSPAHSPFKLVLVHAKPTPIAAIGLAGPDLKSALGKKRRDGKTAPLQPLTVIQRLHIGRLLEKYGDDYQGMFMDTKLNKMQHSVATLEKLCKRYHMNKGKNPLILSS